MEEEEEVLTVEKPKKTAAMAGFDQEITLLEKGIEEAEKVLSKPVVKPIKQDLRINTSDINEEQYYSRLKSIASEPQGTTPTAAPTQVKVIVKPTINHLQMQVASEQLTTEEPQPVSQSVRNQKNENPIEEQGVDSVSLLRAVISQFKPIISNSNYGSVKRGK